MKCKHLLGYEYPVGNIRIVDFSIIILFINISSLGTYYSYKYRIRMALWLLSPLQIHIIFCSFGWLLSLPQRRYLERSTTQKMRSGIVGYNSDDGIIASPAYSRITYTHNMRCVITRKSRTPTNNSKQKKNNIGKMLYNCNLVIFYVYLSPSVLLSLARSAPLCHTIQHAYAKSNGLFSARLHASFFDVPRQILK